MNEFSFIEKYLKPLTFGRIDALGLKDDVAIIPNKIGYDTVITKDAIAENTHFFKDDDPYHLARKLIRVNISDLAAKGAKPYCCFLALALPINTTEEWLKEFARGLNDDLVEFGFFLAGGDTTVHDGPLVLSLTAVGHVKSGEANLRSGANIGDEIFVTGTIGDSYLGLQLLKKAESSFDKDNLKLSLSTSRYFIPLPRLSIGLALNGVATACIDISDGLLADLGHICECSNVGAKIAIDKLPLSDAGSEALKNDNDFRLKAITAGDDYELLFTAPESSFSRINELSLKAGIKISHIGKITATNKVAVINKFGEELPFASSGYKHPLG